MRLMTTLLAGAAGLALTAAAAHATSITQSVQFGPGPTDYNSATGTTTPTTAGGTFNYFDSSLGTLNSITFSSSYGFSSTITVTNTGSSVANGNVRTQSAAQFAATDAAIQAVLNSQVNNYSDPVDGTSVSFGQSTLSPIAYDVRGTKTNYTLNPGQTTVPPIGSTGNSSTSGVTDTTAADLAAFTKAGGGTFTPEFTTLSGYAGSNQGGNVLINQSTTATGTLSITYNYTAPTTTVPEPASMLILGAGLVGLGVVRRRR